MPTIFCYHGFRFMFYSNEHEPVHIHVIKGSTRARFTLFPVSLVENHGLKPAELSLVEGVIRDYREVIAGRWNEYFNKDMESND